jgi:NAD(P)-dependent dehydrogenase (short-subunit alcohol dehydrogenase family)
MPSNPLDLTGRTILVTGASGGIGRDTSVLLSELNAKLILTGRNEEKLKSTLAALSGHNHQVETVDLSVPDAVPQWVKSVVASSGPLHGLVHAAGRQATGALRMASGKSIEDLFKTNLYSAIMLAKGFCQKNCFVPGGSIVFISSVMGLVSKPGISLYSASKAALSGLSRSLALELAADRIRVNCIAPAFVETEMLEQLREMLLPEHFKTLEDAHPLGFGSPRDVANAAAFLLADTGRWITGTTLVVDGGYSAQ